MEFWEKYELIVVKKRPRSEKIFFFHNISRFAMDLRSTVGLNRTGHMSV